MQSTTADAVTLETCDREPIHVPGASQSHGALLAFDAQARLRWCSANAVQVLQAGALAPGMHLDALPQPLPGIVAGELAALQAGESLLQGEVSLPGGAFDLITHASGDFAVLEFEQQQQHANPGTFALQAHRSLDQLRRQKTITALLESAATQVRALTGFDRVMAYRFRHDGSGDIVAEARRDDLEALLGRRYPASDIPLQARRMYVANTLRLIASVQAPPVPLLGTPGEPLDMTHCVLRAVSPIHIEYLTNMGVGASMSVSIVVGGQLWGMLACHHMQAHRVPYPVRMTCDVLAQLLAASVQGLLAAERSAMVANAAELRTRMAGLALREDEPLLTLAMPLAELAASLNAEGGLLSHGGRVAVHGRVDASAAADLTAWLESSVPAGFLALHAAADLPLAVRAALPSTCGLLALRFDAAQAGWLVLLRGEQIETVDWGGKPVKEYRHGPLGPRLTPRGSFELWREIVRGTAEPWSANELEIARLLADELGRAFAARAAEMNRAKDRLLAVLGHDLRNPLQTISMSAHVLARGMRVQEVGSRIQSASTRMERLISQVLDLSRLQSGMGLGTHREPLDLGSLILDLLADERVAWTATAYDADVQQPLAAEADPDRIAQLLGNLLTNARQHGKPGQPIRVSARREGAEVAILVANAADPIPAATAEQLFVPFKRESLNKRDNPGGMGLGLYIASEIARDHGGRLSYRHAQGQAIFEARFPATITSGAATGAAAG